MWGCGKLTVSAPDVCEVVYPDVVGEGFEVEFSPLGFSLATGQVVFVASLQGAVD
jgi:hypothetical protein